MIKNLNNTFYHKNIFENILILYYITYHSIQNSVESGIKGF